MNETQILDFIAEAGILKRVRRSGWDLLGIPGGESVAEHSFRCAVIGYILAVMEEADPYKVLLMTLFNDLHEARIGDQHKVAHRYIDARNPESTAFKEMLEVLESGLGSKTGLAQARREQEGQKTREALISRDADILECLIQAKEYSDMGFRGAERFFRKGPGHLKTESAKKLWGKAKKWDSGDWWKDLEKFER